MEKRFAYVNDIQAIPQIRKDLEELAVQWGWPPSELKQIILIAEELFTTTIRYAFQDEAEHQVKFILSMINRMVVAEIIDDGIPFNPMEYNPDIQTNPAALDEGGMGLMLIKAFSDSIDYRRAEHKNHLVIRKMIKPNLEKHE
ncbi:MAG: ATP-binding protein [Bacteroidota bacterium]